MCAGAYIGEQGREKLESKKGCTQEKEAREHSLCVCV